MTPEQLVAAVVAWLGVKADGPDATHATTVAPAVVAWVDSMPSTSWTTADPPTWAGDTQLGAIMLAARLVRRRNSPNGIEAFAADQVAYTSRHDPDVALLLRLGLHKLPQIG